MNEPKNVPKKSWQKKLLFVFACLVTLVALFYAEEDLRGKYDWDSFKHQWEAKGESFDRASVIPPAVPDEENFAMSPVFIAAERYTFQNELDRARAWYGDKIDDASVTKLLPLFPCNLADVTGFNWIDAHLPLPPGVSGQWTTARLTDLRPLQTYYRDLETKHPEVHISITPQPQSPAADVLLALSKYDPVIEQLRRDASMPSSRFPIQYDAEDPTTILLPHLATMKQLASVLQMRAIAELQNGQTDKALDDIRLMLRLATALRTEPILISQLVNIAIVNLALQPVYEGLAAHQWSDAQLATINSDLAQVDFLVDYKLAMHAEMDLFEGGIIDYMRHHPGTMYNMGNPDGSSRASFPADALAHLVPNAWFYQNQLACARAVEELYLPAADTNRDIVSPAFVRKSAEKLDGEIRHYSPYTVFERMLLPALGGAAQRFAYGQNSANMARVAVALERLYLVHGQYPDTLDSLAPHYIDAVPHDIINGEPLHYRRTPDGQFILYSVGWNERDDGGTVVSKGKNNVDNTRGDWVWQYPAK